jgi:hypothetical protein
MMGLVEGDRPWCEASKAVMDRYWHEASWADDVGASNAPGSALYWYEGYVGQGDGRWEMGDGRWAGVKIGVVGYQERKRCGLV